jgi:hypothetical protein
METERSCSWSTRAAVMGADIAGGVPDRPGHPLRRQPLPGQDDVALVPARITRRPGWSIMWIPSCSAQYRRAPGKDKTDQRRDRVTRDPTELDRHAATDGTTTGRGERTWFRGVRGLRTCCLPSGFSPSVLEFHQVNRPLAADGSRTLTAGSELHRPRSTCRLVCHPPDRTTERGSGPRLTAAQAGQMAGEKARNLISRLNNNVIRLEPSS